MNESTALVAYVTSPSLAFFVRARRRLRHALCLIVNGGHELYKARTPTKLYQECLLCGYETPGWEIDRRDRRLHLVGRRKAS